MDEKVKKILIALTVLVSLSFLALPVFASNPAVITATVSPVLISVTVDRGLIDYGVVSLGDAKESGLIVATNNGTVVEDFDIKGAIAQSGASQWSLVTGVPGENQFRHSFAIREGGSFGALTPLTSGNENFKDNIASSGVVDFKLKLEMPSSITGVYDQYTTSVTVTATMH